MSEAVLQGEKAAAGRWFGPLLVLSGGICIGFAPIGLRLGIELGDNGLGAQAIAFWRFAFAVPVAFGLILIAHRRVPARPNRFVLMAGFFFAFNVGFWHWALTLTTVANSTFIVNLGNISVGLLAWVFLKDRLSWNWGAAVLVALIGAALLTQGGGEGAKGDMRGDMLAVLGAIFVSFYVLCAKIGRRRLGGLDTLFWVVVMATATSAVLTLIEGGGFVPADPAGWQAPLLLAIIVQCLGQGLILAGLGRTPAGIAGVLILVQPVTAAAISWRFFDEPLMALQILGGGLILVSVALSQTGQKLKTEA